MSHEQQKNPATFWVGFFLGGLIGALAVFLMGTKKGKQVLEEALQKVELYEQGIEDHLSGLEDTSSELLKKVQEVKESVVEHLEHKKEEVTDLLSENLIPGAQDVISSEDVQRKFFTKDGKRLAA